MKGMSIFFIIAVIALGAGLFVYKMGKKASVSQAPPATEMTNVTTPAVTSGTLSTDTSDSGLTKDTADIQSQATDSDKDTANIDTSLNDQMGDLSEQ